MAKSGIESAHKRLSERLMSMPGVSGTAIGECGGKPCIKVYLDGTRRLGSSIPSRFKGFRVSVEKTGIPSIARATVAPGAPRPDSPTSRIVTARPAGTW